MPNEKGNDCASNCELSQLRLELVGVMQELRSQNEKINDIRGVLFGEQGRSGLEVEVARINTRLTLLLGVLSAFALALAAPLGMSLWKVLSGGG